MKKIIISIFMLGSCGAVLAQSTATEVNGVRTENKPVITTEATINGIPYSKYKAQQEALTKQQSNQPNQNKVVLAKVSDNNSVDGQTPTGNALPSGNQQLTGKSSTITPQPVIVPQEPKAEKQNVQPVTDVQKPKGPEAKIITADDLKGFTAPQKELVPVNAATATKPVTRQAELPYADKTIPGTLVPKPVLTMGTGSQEAAVPAAVNENKMPQQVISTEGLKTEPEVPASVAPKTIKVPAVPKQGGDN